MSERIEADLCVIGAGSAGSAAAMLAAALGAKVVLVERGRVGGRHLASGVPQAALGAAARQIFAARATAAALGLPPPEGAIDEAALAAHLREVEAGIAPNGAAARLEALGVRLIRAEARFRDADTVIAGDAVVAARRCVIATGSRPLMPPIEGLAGLPVLTTDTIHRLAARPANLAVLGSGSEAVALAQVQRRLGAAVTLIGPEPLLPEQDAELAAIVARALAAEGVTLRLGQPVRAVAAGPDGLALTLGPEAGGAETVAASHLLVASGREPAFDGLNLAAAGIAHGAEGIVVDRGLRTSNRRVFAIGSCTGGEGGAGGAGLASAEQGALVIRAALFRMPIRFDRSRVVRLMATDPELASVGLGEAAARARHGVIRILRWPLAETERARAERRLAGHVKAITDRRGRILGCGIVAPGAGDLIAPWALALAKGLSANDLAALSLPAATLAEASKRAALEFLRPQAQSPWLKRLLAVARWLG